MDGSNIDHSDSDSGDSWTLLDNTPTHGDDAPEFLNNLKVNQDPPEAYLEKDEDTDGISVISDSEQELTTPCDISYDNYRIEQNRPVERSNPQMISINPLPSNNNGYHESIRSEDDFLGDSTGKHKTYVHRRNKRLSTVLNIIMLGSVITAAGVAIGHMWGARYDCAMHTTPSVNKILSNLYKLQEENAHLRNKLKELTLASSIQLQQRKVNVEKLPFKQQRCKKIYEEPLSNKNVEKVTKCIDFSENSEKLLIEPEYEKDFMQDIGKLKNIYQQNRSWLDEEIAKRLKNEENTINKLTNNMKSPLSSIMEEQKGFQDDDLIKEQVNSNIQPAKTMVTEDTASTHNNLDDDTGKAFPLPEMKITYADSLKSDYKPHNIEKRDINIRDEQGHREHIPRKKNKNENDMINTVISEEELKKDDRWGQKANQEKKKRDKPKSHKKQKRRNKYEQWEMKGGYLKDYDELSISSSQDNENTQSKLNKKHPSRDLNKNKYFNQFSETDNYIKETKNENESINSEKHTRLDKDGKNKNEDFNWYDKRAALRTEARKRIEHELFSETSPSNAGWYFRRMQRRERCRAKANNSTHRKFFKQNINLKIKQ